MFVDVERTRLLSESANELVLNNKPHSCLSSMERFPQSPFLPLRSHFFYWRVLSFVSGKSSWWSRALSPQDCNIVIYLDIGILRFGRRVGGWELPHSWVKVRWLVTRTPYIPKYRKNWSGWVRKKNICYGNRERRSRVPVMLRGESTPGEREKVRTKETAWPAYEKTHTLRDLISSGIV